MRKLRVSANRRFLVHDDGSPFYWFGDTAWELFHRASREDAERYLVKRNGQRFTLIQAVVLAEEDGIRAPNAYGNQPLINEDPARPNEEYYRPGAIRWDGLMALVHGSLQKPTPGLTVLFSGNGTRRQTLYGSSAATGPLTTPNNWLSGEQWQLG